jgi:hypothetical protein
VNDGEEVEIAPHQIMKCILCYDNVEIFLIRELKKEND